MAYQNLIRFLTANPTATAYETISDDWQSPDHYNPTPEEIQQRIAEIHAGKAADGKEIPNKRARIARRAAAARPTVEWKEPSKAVLRNGCVHIEDEDT